MSECLGHPATPRYAYNTTGATYDSLLFIAYLRVGLLESMQTNDVRAEKL